MCVLRLSVLADTLDSVLDDALAELATQLRATIEAEGGGVSAGSASQVRRLFQLARYVEAVADKTADAAARPDRYAPCTVAG